MIKKISAIAAALTLTASAAGMVPFAGEANVFTASAADEINSLPPRVDLSTSEYFPGIFNQGRLGSCASSSTTFYQFTYEARKALREKYPDADIDFVYSPAFTYPQINGGVHSGTDENNAYELFKYNGAVTLKDFPYDGNYGVEKDDNQTYYARNISTGKYISRKDYDAPEFNDRDSYIIDSSEDHYANYVSSEVYNKLSDNDKKQLEPTEDGRYRRIGEYISENQYNALSENDKKYYIRVIDGKKFQGKYLRFVRVFRAIPRDEQALFDALKIRLVNSYSTSHALGFIKKVDGVKGPVLVSKEEADASAEKVILEMKQALNQGKILVTGGSFNYETKKTYASNDLAAYECRTQSSGSHSYTIVGYDDTIKCDINGDGFINPNSEIGAFKIVNSWGDDWDNNGFLWVMYDTIYRESRTGTKLSDERTISMRNANYIDVAVKDIKLVSEAQVMTNNYFDVKVDNSCDGQLLDNAGYKNFSAPVIYSGPIFTDITGLCSDDRGNGREYDITVNNRNAMGDTKVLVKSICIKDDKGNVVASKEYADKAYSDAVIGEDFNDSLSVDLPKGDMNYDGVLDQNDWDKVSEYFRIKMSIADSKEKEKEVREKFSFFQEELLDANDDGVINPEDYYILEASLNA